MPYGANSRATVRVKPEQSCLTGSIARLPVQATCRGSRGNIDDTPPSFFLQRRQYQSREIKWSVQVDRKLMFPGCRFHEVSTRDIRSNAGVIDQNLWRAISASCSGVNQYSVAIAFLLS